MPAPATSDHDLGAVGKSIYREGRLPSGKPVTAVVLGDVPVEGPQAPCVQCHQRSGFGTSEGNEGALPVTGSMLYGSREQGYRPRPAYTDDTLATAIRAGIDPAGHPLNSLMPLYKLSDPEMDGLITYLKTLSAEVSPGVTETTIHFATVITEDVDPTSRRAMLDILETFFQEKNGQTRGEERRSAFGSFYRDRVNKAYRRWILHEWLLSGSPDTWPAQLDAYYRQDTVFAMISGISATEWRPIHRFCETHEIPCLLPNTDLPAITNGDDFYTLYFSQGVALEAHTIAEDIFRHFPSASILQVFHPNTAGSVAANALRQAVSTHEGISVVDWPVLPDGTLTADRLAGRVKDGGATVLVLWLKDLSALATQPWNGNVPVRVYLSSTLLGGEVTQAPEATGVIWFMAHPYRLPADLTPRVRRMHDWLKSRKIDLREARIQFQTYFACLIAGEALAHVNQFFYRDYLMDFIDHADAMANFSVYYPQLSFGPGQRYLAKGSYILELKREAAGPVIAKTSWVVPPVTSRP